MTSAEASGEGVGGEGLEGVAAAPVEISERGDEVDVGKDEAHVADGDVVVEDALDVALRCVGGGEEDGLAEADDEDGDGDSEPEPGDVAERWGCAAP